MKKASKKTTKKTVKRARASKVESLTPLESLAKFAAVRFPGPWKAGVQVSHLGDEWYCAVHSYEPQHGHQKRVVQCKAYAPTLAAAVVKCAQVLVSPEIQLANLQKALLAAIEA